MNPEIPISIIILTYNEEINLKACLDSVAPFGDIHILDSGSTDGTGKIAREFGVQVYFNAFKGFGQQRNWAIDNIPTRFDWQFHLDADERVTPELILEMQKEIVEKSSIGGFLIPNKLLFAGRWLRFAGQYPAYQLRLFHRARLRFVDHGHGQREQTNFPVAKLKSPYLHYAFSKGLDHWFAKHAVYARREAEQAFGMHALAKDQSTQDGTLFSFDPVSRRRALKRLSFRLPFRYFFRYCYMLFWKRAILDGTAGITYSQMLATYEAMIAVHLRLLRNGLKPDS
jgi:glycosyltransferase involved in cell wall biosynthesis